MARRFKATHAWGCSKPTNRKIPMWLYPSYIYFLNILRLHPCSCEKYLNQKHHNKHCSSFSYHLVINKVPINILILVTQYLLKNLNKNLTQTKLSQHKKQQLHINYYIYWSLQTNEHIGIAFQEIQYRYTTFVAPAPSAVPRKTFHIETKTILLQQMEKFLIEFLLLPLGSNKIVATNTRYRFLKVN